eukprot:scaffold60228_cov18-Prasinocladus_malaysianus.AAC.1
MAPNNLMNGAGATKGVREACEPSIVGYVVQVTTVYYAGTYQLYIVMAAEGHHNHPHPQILTINTEIDGATTYTSWLSSAGGAASCAASAEGHCELGWPAASTCKPIAVGGQMSSARSHESTLRMAAFDNGASLVTAN